MNSALAKMLFLLCALPHSALAAPSRLPDWLPLAPGMDVAEVRADERYGEALVPTPKQDRQVVRGHRWEATLRIKGAGSEASGKALWARWKPVLAQQGWTAEDERETTPYAVSARLTKGRDAWFRVTLFDANDIRIDLVEVGENRLKPLRAAAKRAQILVSTSRTRLRDARLEATVVAAQTAVAQVQHQIGRAAMAIRGPAAGAAGQHRRITAAIEEEQALLGTRQALFDRPQHGAGEAILRFVDARVDAPDLRQAGAFDRSFVQRQQLVAPAAGAGGGIGPALE